MIIETIESMKQVLSLYKNPVIAYSGGKDGFVVAHIANQIIPNIKMITEISFYFPKQTENIKNIAKKHNFNVTYFNSLDDNWLLRNKEIIFTNDTKLRSKSFQLRHQTSVKKFAKSINADLTIFGRRTEENSVPKKLYKTINGMQYHPLRDWKENDIWEYYNKINEPKPFIYNTKFGSYEGNAPFYTFKRNDKTIDECWDIINEIDTDKIFYNKFK